MNIKKIIVIIVILALMVGINLFSSQTATESDRVSSKIAKTVVTKLGIITEEQAQDDSHPIIEQADHIIRKAAHFSIYFFLAFILYIFFYWQMKNPWKAFFIAWIIAIVYAMFDEYHQTFVNGRSGEIRDVIIDSSGALCGILVCKVIMLFINKKKGEKY
ncbi:teicoplanin resistance protein VanZ [Vallitalea longa]|uniref:Teicoplanin resistance protein VanZ n=1 Tax=Vallitalea longa TaxID=2936439 RepID=A0A9W5YI81_9FIRM|nr:VanZ family protein [Vallitalea longa]GKX31753.1 teicoplanin resistance protein VanZ [Vallitalea longa]